jgi:succinyl-CoA synthetase beta subunit
MNLHEYQAKEILKKYGVPVAEGIVASTAEEAVAAAKKLTDTKGSQAWVVKAQIHAGGRGKGGGVKFSTSLDKVRENASNILGMHLITPQTSAEGKLVSLVFVQEDAYYDGPSERKEFYFSMLLDRAKSQLMFMYSTQGGMNIEHVAENTPELIFVEHIDPTVGLKDFQCRKIANNYGLAGLAFNNMVKFVRSIYNAYIGSDATLFEINPLLKAADDKIMAIDAKVNLDDNALYRHPELAALRDITEEDPTEVEAGAFNLNYVKLNGNVGCMVNGAGLAMATMDIIKLSGGDPANFLDVGGTANAQRVEQGFRIILSDPNVKVILVNIFGGIVRCDRVAQGIVDAYKNIGDIKVPIIVRLQGTNAIEAKVIIEESGLKVYPAVKLEEAAALVTKLVR